MFFRKKKKER